MRSRAPILVVLILLVALGVVGYSRFGSVRPARAGLLEATGHVEGERTVVVTRAGGRIVELLAQEGDSVARGQVVARLGDPEAPARVDQARLAIATLDSRLRSERAALAVLQAKVPLAIRAGEANVELAHAVLRQIENQEDLQRQEIERLREIEEPDDPTKERLFEAELAHEQTEQEILVAQAAVERAETDLELARFGADEIAAGITEVEAIQTEREQAAAAFADAERLVESLEVVAPAFGTIMVRSAEVGDSVPAGGAVIETMDPGSLHVIVELTESERGAIRPGQAARVYADSAPGGFVDARVTALVGGTKGVAGAAKLLMERDPANILSLGMRVRVVIRVREDAAWP